MITIAKSNVESSNHLDDYIRVNVLLITCGGCVFEQVRRLIGTK